MNTESIHKFVEQHHPYTIFQMSNASGSRKDKWKTYLQVDGKRKEIVRASEEEILNELYYFYTEVSAKRKKMKEVFEELRKCKLNEMGRACHTVYIDRQRFNELSMTLQNKPIAEVSREDIRKWIVSTYLPTKPTEEALRRMFQLLSQIFEFAILHEECESNPMRYIPSYLYLSKCSHKRKPNEERQFSEKELEKLYEQGIQDPDNPRAVMMLVAMETGLRVGELTALHKEDIHGNFLHIHRQQIRGTYAYYRMRTYDVDYTKDERMHPHDGRYVPITDRCREALDLALSLPGESEYLFHSLDGQAIKKDSYHHYLRRQCKRLGTLATNNHAFRIAFNSRMIDLGFCSADRALILGHNVATNEKNYSITDNRRLNKLLEQLKGTAPG